MVQVILTPFYLLGDKSYLILSIGISYIHPRLQIKYKISDLHTFEYAFHYNRLILNK
jgi:hypothetical protein